MDKLKVLTMKARVSRDKYYASFAIQPTNQVNYRSTSIRVRHISPTAFHEHPTLISIAVHYLLSISFKMALFSTVFLCIALPYTLWCCQSLFANYRKAQKSGFPIIVCPANTSNILWMLFSVTFRTLLAQYLPSFAYDHVKAGIYGWEFICRYELFARIGSSFILVTPGKNELWVADPEVTHSILMGKNDFFQLDVATRKPSLNQHNRRQSSNVIYRHHGYVRAKCHYGKRPPITVTVSTDDHSLKEKTGNVTGRSLHRY